MDVDPHNPRMQLAPVKKLGAWLGAVFTEGQCRCDRCLHPEAYPRRKPSDRPLRPHTVSLGERDHRRRFAISSKEDVVAAITAAFVAFHKYDGEVAGRARIDRLRPSDLFPMLPPELWQRLAAILFESELLFVSTTGEQPADDSGLYLGFELRRVMATTLEKVRVEPDDDDDEGDSEAA